MWEFHTYNELYHHGILGQKWGKKNGPPYPLAAGDHSAAEKKAGWKSSLKSSSSSGAEQKFVPKKSKRDQIEADYDKEYWSIWQEHDSKLMSRIKQLSKTDAEAKRILSIDSKSKQASAIDDYMDVTTDPELKKIHNNLIDSLDRIEAVKDDKLARVNLDYRSEKGDKIGAIYEKAIRRDRALTDREQRKIEKEYINRMRPNEIKSIAEALENEERCQRLADEAYSKYEEQCRKDSQTRKILDNWTGDGSEYYELMQKRHPNAKVDAIVSKEYAAMVNTEKVVNSVIQRLYDDYKDLELKDRKSKYSNDYPRTHALNASYAAGKKSYQQKYSSKVKSMKSQGLTYAEIAKKLGISESTVSSILN